MPTLGTLGLVLLAGLIGVAAYRNRRVRGALNVLLPVFAIAALSLGSAPSLNAQATDPNTTYAGSVNDAIQSVRAVVDAAGNVAVTGTRANSCVVDLPGTASVNGPVSSTRGLITLNLAGSDGNGIASWQVTLQRFSPFATTGSAVQLVANGAGNPPSTLVVLHEGQAGNWVIYTLRITDTLGNISTGSWRVEKV